MIAHQRSHSLPHGILPEFHEVFFVLIKNSSEGINPLNLLQGFGKPHTTQGVQNL